MPDFTDNEWHDAVETAYWQLPVHQGFRNWAAAGFPDGGLSTFLAFWQLHRSAPLGEWKEQFLPSCRRMSLAAASWLRSRDVAYSVASEAERTKLQRTHTQKMVTPWTALSKAAYALRPDIAVVDDSLVRAALGVSFEKRAEGTSSEFEKLWDSEVGARACQAARGLSPTLSAVSFLAEWDVPNMMGRRILDCLLMEKGRVLLADKQTDPAAKGAARGP